MSGQSGTVEMLDNRGDPVNPHLHHPEGSEEEVDKEWEEFSRLMAKLKANRKNHPHRY